ncbi:hypothetical protein A2419_00605 [Candidatus Adlerbacteria bacterium RIFOXYC1_FULL_48_26]|uniref:NYN domain-containing protein n=1 Tax=Candidatus Adlerbacteria bacterium RIFOXYC1_FULL_48_26 TaxID=1797247 RepID=A0A1F4Y4Y1_9BACT|nr:MAG: hypothetical protein A2419_00605 [Candidatus Adlerbacteria bacterium RIFOXYC1_FULL_48_26]OGC94585.1 MAG: hypothetical protein A2389_01630 [Candidatus Adlerbacteria bacterium RIFOXYB1_FULL_48_10]
MNGTNARGRLALVDGVSLERSLSTHGINKIDADMLRRLLKSKIPGAYEFLQNPVITMHPELADGELGSAFVRKGFEVLGRHSRDEADDYALRERIENADPAKIGQIVMVSSDAGYARALFEKWKQGVSICWFVADSCDEKDGDTRIGRLLRKFFACGAFTWVRMEPFIASLQYPSSALEGKRHRQGTRPHAHSM